MADAGATAALLVHPSILLNMADHSLRIRSLFAQHNIQYGGGAGGAGDSHVRRPAKVCAGILFGTQSGKRVEIFSSVEMHVEVSEQGSPVVDEAFFREQRDLMSEVFPEHEPLGWYIVSGGSGLRDAELSLHRQISALIESPLLLHLDDLALQAPNQRKVPLIVYQADERGASASSSSSASASSSSSSGQFSLQALPFKVEASEVERLVVDHVTTTTTTTTTASSAPTASSTAGQQPRAGGVAVTVTDPMAAHWASQLGALSMLRERLSVLEAYLEAVKRGALPMDRAILRSISNTLPEGAGAGVGVDVAARTGSNAGLARDMALEGSDSLALALLSSVAQGAEAAASVALKLSAADAVGRTTLAQAQSSQAHGSSGHMDLLAGRGMSGGEARLPRGHGHGAGAGKRRPQQPQQASIMSMMGMGMGMARGGGDSDSEHHYAGGGAEIYEVDDHPYDHGHADDDIDSAGSGDAPVRVPAGRSAASAGASHSAGSGAGAGLGLGVGEKRSQRPIAADEDYADEGKLAGDGDDGDSVELRDATRRAKMIGLSLDRERRGAGGGGGGGGTK